MRGVFGLLAAVSVVADELFFLVVSAGSSIVTWR